VQWDASRALLRTPVGRLLEGQRTLVMQCTNKRCNKFSCSAADPFVMEEVIVQPRRPARRPPKKSW
jgi:hypothetical protein